MPSNDDEQGVARPLVIGIVGGSGSGKTTVARAIQEVTGVAAALIDHDAYYKDLADLSLEERRRVNFDHPDSLDNELLATHLRQLSDGHDPHLIKHV